MEISEALIYSRSRACASCWMFRLRLLVIKHHSDEESRKFVNVAVLEGDQIKWIDEHAADVPNCPALMTSLLGFESPASWVHSVNALVQLAVSMRADGRGGSLLPARAAGGIQLGNVLPAGLDSWQESIAGPIPSAVSPPFSRLSELSRGAPNETSQQVWQEAFSRTVESIAGLTAVDGAVVITDQYELLGFGAKITRRKGWDRAPRRNCR
jgi:hypothetical protein